MKKIICIALFSYILGNLTCYLKNCMFNDGKKYREIYAFNPEKSITRDKYIEFLEDQNDICHANLEFYFTVYLNSDTHIERVKQIKRHHLQMLSSIISIAYDIDKAYIENANDEYIAFMFSRITYYLDEGIFTEEMLTDPLWIREIFESNKNCYQSIITPCNMEVLTSEDEYNKFKQWFIKQINYYKVNREEIERKYHGYNIDFSRRLYQDWWKNWGKDLGMPKKYEIH